MKVKVKLSGCQHKDNLALVHVGDEVELFRVTDGRDAYYIKHNKVKLGEVDDPEFIAEIKRIIKAKQAHKIRCVLVGQEQIASGKPFYRNTVEFDLPVVLEGKSLWDEYVVPALAAKKEAKEDLFLAGLVMATSFVTKEELNIYIDGYKKGKSSLCPKPPVGK